MDKNITAKSHLNILDFLTKFWNKIVNLKKFKDIFYSSKDNLLGERFDGIAWGLQKFTEIISKWTKIQLISLKLITLFSEFRCSKC